ncbi:hypothetical protein HZA26_00590 [Candidatus Nomurabacteria bacterium]|nr:hypothetical protein [Candidatus Nomurabacteria bacterium]
MVDRDVIEEIARRVHRRERRAILKREYGAMRPGFTTTLIIDEVFKTEIPEDDVPHVRSEVAQLLPQMRLKDRKKVS